MLEADIFDALDSGALKGALEVFEHEPLPRDSRLWTHPAVHVSPHNAAIATPEATAAFVTPLRRYCFLQVSMVSGVQTSRPIVTGSGTDLPCVRSFRR